MKSRKSYKTPPSGPRRLFLVDDHPMTRRGLIDLINQEADLTVCGEAEDAAGALEHIKRLKPRLALVDITLPGASGLTLIQDLRACAPSVKLLALSMHDENVYAERVLRAGGHGYIMKNEGGDRLLSAIRYVLDDNIYVSENVSRQLVDTFAAGAPPASVGVASRLTDREFEVFRLLGQGLSSAEIAARLHVSSKTIDSHRLRIKNKLDMDSLPALLRHAVRWAATEETI